MANKARFAVHTEKSFNIYSLAYFTTNSQPKQTEGIPFTPTARIRVYESIPSDIKSSALK